MVVPTPDPSLIPALTSAATGIFTANWQIFLTAGLGLLMAIGVPLVVLRGGLHKAIAGIKGVFGAGKA